MKPSIVLYIEIHPAIYCVVKSLFFVFSDKKNFKLQWVDALLWLLF